VFNWKQFVPLNEFGTIGAFNYPILTVFIKLLTFSLVKNDKVFSFKTVKAGTPFKIIPPPISLVYSLVIRAIYPYLILQSSSYSRSLC
jgi:hypothetical protein